MGKVNNQDQCRHCQCFMHIEKCLQKQCSNKDAWAFKIINEHMSRLESALEQFAHCDLNESNCADLNVATKRIRNVAREALKKGNIK